MASLMVVAACGRIAFDPTSTGEGDASASASDADGDGVTSPDDSGAGDAAALPCSAAGITCSATATVECNSRCWLHCNNQVTRVVAAQRCVEWSGRLAKFETTADRTCALTPGLAGWIDLVQPAGQSTAIAGWMWATDGTAPVMSYWAAGQPNDSDGVEDDQEQCGFATASAAWQDAACTTVLGFLCTR